MPIGVTGYLHAGLKGLAGQEMPDRAKVLKGFGVPQSILTALNGDMSES